MSAKRTVRKVRFILKSNREAVKDGTKLRNKSKKMTEKCQFVEEALDSWLPECGRLTELLFSSSAMKHLGKPAVLVCMPIFPVGSPRAGLLWCPLLPRRPRCSLSRAIEQFCKIL